MCKIKETCIIRTGNEKCGPEIKDVGIYRLKIYRTVKITNGRMGFFIRI